VVGAAGASTLGRGVSCTERVRSWPTPAVRGDAARCRHWRVDRTVGGAAYQSSLSPALRITIPQRACSSRISAWNSSGVANMGVKLNV
jgi:hypothetical protein